MPSDMNYKAVYNRFMPTTLVPRPYGWTRAPAYNRGDVPSALLPTHPLYTQEYIAQAMAYEWMGSSELADRNYSNPPFTSGAAGRLHPLLTNASGESARILRGFIRRSQYEAGDPVSKARLYFMWNPEQITREYVSYLDQQALDPFNTVYGSGNLVAPPSFMNFRFDMFFDRQMEATNAVSNPGVLADYQFFDLVVRNVIPSDPNQASNQLPDNGVMMVNPRDITVVFSPQLTVQGRPINAQVVFEKFTHRMTPIRMRISLEMRVMYFGPMLEQSEYRMQQSEVSSEVSVPVDDQILFDLTFTNIAFEDVEDMEEVVFLPAASNRNAAADAANAGANLGPEGSNIVPVAGITGGLDRRLAPVATSMIAAAAAAGITLSGGGYRSSASQAALRRTNGCPDLTSPSSTCRVPTAPLVNGRSTSEHTKGLAIDFSNCSSGSARFNWLVANAGRYGLRNLPSEPWHWSTTGR